MSKEYHTFDFGNGFTDFAVRIIRLAESLSKTKIVESSRFYRDWANLLMLISIFMTSIQTARQKRKKFMIRHFLFDIRYLDFSLLTFFEASYPRCPARDMGHDQFIKGGMGGFY